MSVKQDIDLRYHWMPFTANVDFKKEPRMVVKGEGVYYWSQDGRQILDGSSGLFCSPAGHSRPEIAQAVAEQLHELSYVPPFQIGQPLSFQFAERVAKHTPEGLDNIFFVNSGSESVDTAMKIALAYHYARGDGTRQRFVSRERAYHGVNFGGVALSGMVKNRQIFGVAGPAVAHMRHTWLEENRFARDQPEHGAELANDLERIIQNYGTDTIAACFVEPVAGSTGCLVPPVGYLERLREICDQYGVLLVFDEVITGFGRLGAPFASQAFGVVPDMMTMAKALTNAAQPMGAVAVHDKVYNAIVGASPDDAIELFHGYTYSGHPGACAAGIATMDIFERENLFERAAELSPYFQDAIFSLQDVPQVMDVRGYGMMAGVDVKPNAVPGTRGGQVQKALFKAGLHVKFTGDSGIVAPPFVAEKDHIDRIVSILRDEISKID